MLIGYKFVLITLPMQQLVQANLNKIDAGSYLHVFFCMLTKKVNSGRCGYEVPLTLKGYKLNTGI